MRPTPNEGKSSNANSSNEPAVTTCNSGISSLKNHSDMMTSGHACTSSRNSSVRRGSMRLPAIAAICATIFFTSISCTLNRGMYDACFSKFISM